MPVYTVNIPGGTNDHDFEAYKRLLEEAGVDLSAAPRIHDPGTSQRWLYVWHDRAFAERFARELQTRTRNKRWEVNELESSQEEVGPLAPLDIVVSFSPDGEIFRLMPTSQNRIMTRFPNARLVNELLWSADEREGHERQHGSIWDLTASTLMGLSENQIEQLGGYRVIEPYGKVLHESEAVPH